jgi:hypothetical protein
MSGGFMWDFPVSTQAQSETHPSLSCSPRKDPIQTDQEVPDLATLTLAAGSGGP